MKDKKAVSAEHDHKEKDDTFSEFLEMKIGEQTFGVPVLSVRDVLVVKEITHVPLAPQEIIGLINLRGRIVTALDIRAILKIVNNFDLNNSVSVVVEYEEELYSLMVDSIGEVINIPRSKIIHNPENLSKNWKDISTGIYPNQNYLVVLVNINKLLKVVDVNKENQYFGGDA